MKMVANKPKHLNQATGKRFHSVSVCVFSSIDKRVIRDIRSNAVLSLCRSHYFTSATRGISVARTKESHQIHQLN